MYLLARVGAIRTSCCVAEFERDNRRTYIAEQHANVSKTVVPVTIRLRFGCKSTTLRLFIDQRHDRIAALRVK